MEWVSSLLYNFSAFVLIISVIVFIHEFGHYFVAKLSGVKIEVFSIGFGPELCGWNDRSGTRWKISALPLGGYVKMFGDINSASAPDTQRLATLTPTEKEWAFQTKPLWKKASIVAAGPVANFILAIVILTGFFIAYGKPITLSEVSQVLEGSAAQKAGIEPGDVITSIDGQSVKTFEDIQRIVSINTGTPLSLELVRKASVVSLEITPVITEREDIFGNVVKAPVLGIASQVQAYQEMHIGSARPPSWSPRIRACRPTLSSASPGNTTSPSPTMPISPQRWSTSRSMHRSAG
jgi:regulator of sigma E protease